MVATYKPSFTKYRKIADEILKKQLNLEKLEP